MHCCVYRHYYSHLMQLFVILMTVNGDELSQFNCSRQLLYVYSSNCCKWIADKYVQSSVGKRILWGMPGKTNILFLPSWVLLFPFPHGVFQSKVFYKIYILACLIPHIISGCSFVSMHKDLDSVPSFGNNWIDYVCKFKTFLDSLGS